MTMADFPCSLDWTRQALAYRVTHHARSLVSQAPAGLCSSNPLSLPPWILTSLLGSSIAMSSEKIRPSKLKFKGEKTKKKRKHEDGDEPGPSRRRRKDEDNEGPETWVLPEAANEIRGPVFILHPSDPSPICVTYDSTRGRIVLQSVDKDKSEGSETPAILERTPTEVSQVWVVTRVAG